MFFAIALNVLVPLLSILGSIIFWIGFFEGLEWFHLISVFLCYIFAVVPTNMYADHIKYKYESLYKIIINKILNKFPITIKNYV